MLGTANWLPNFLGTTVWHSAAGSLLQMKLQGEDADDAEDAEKEDADDARVLRAPQSPPRPRLRVVAPFPLFLGWHCHGAPACSTDRFLGNPSCGTPRERFSSKLRFTFNGQVWHSHVGNWSTRLRLFRYLCCFDYFACLLNRQAGISRSLPALTPPPACSVLRREHLGPF